MKKLIRKMRRLEEENENLRELLCVSKSTISYHSNNLKEIAKNCDNIVKSINKRIKLKKMRKLPS